MGCGGVGWMDWVYSEELDGVFGCVSAGMSGRNGSEVRNRGLSGVLRALIACCSSRLHVPLQVGRADLKARWVPLCARS